MQSDWISLDRQDGIAHLRLHRPPVNQFDAPLLEEILAAVGTIGEETRALVVSSDIEGCFAAGGDIPWMAGGAASRATRLRRPLPGHLHLLRAGHLPGGHRDRRPRPRRRPGAGALLRHPRRLANLQPRPAGVEHRPDRRRRRHPAAGPGDRPGGRAGHAADRAADRRRRSARAGPGEQARRAGRGHRRGARDRPQARRWAGRGDRRDQAPRGRRVGGDDRGGPGARARRVGPMRPSRSSQEGLTAFAERRRPDFDAARRGETPPGPS